MELSIDTHPQHFTKKKSSVDLHIKNIHLRTSLKTNLQNFCLNHSQHKEETMLPSNLRKNTKVMEVSCNAYCLNFFVNVKT